MNSDNLQNDTIKLDQFLKFMNIVSSGGEAKHLIQQGDIKVNGEVETRRGRKLRAGDQVEFAGQLLIVEQLGNKTELDEAEG